MAPQFNNSFVTLTNFNSKVVTADASTPATNLFLRNLTIWALQNRQNTLVLTNLAVPMEITRGLTLSNGAALQVYHSDLVIDGTAGGEMSLTAANTTVNNSSLRLTNAALLKVGNGPGIATLTLSNGTIQAGGDVRVGSLARSVGRLSLASGLVDIGGEFTVADASGSTGAVVVLNGTLQAMNTNVNTRIGERGLGSLAISNGLARFDDVSVGRQDTGRGALIVAGGEFACGTLSVGRFLGSMGMAAVFGGKLNVEDGSLYVGREGTGTLTNAGGTITASRLHVPGPTNSANGSAMFSGGESIFTSGVAVGSAVSSGQITIAGGSLYCTNTTGTSTGVVTAGTLSLLSGRACFDVLTLASGSGQLQLKGGTLCVADLVVSNGVPFVVGDGLGPATLELRGMARFANGIIVSPQAALTGCGIVSGAITVMSGGSNTLTNCPPTVPSITISAVAAVPGGVRFSINTAAGLTYTLEYKSDLSAPWDILQSFSGTGSLVNVTNAPVPGTNRFYRVRSP